jgi:hypothetical protein
VDKSYAVHETSFSLSDVTLRNAVPNAMPSSIRLYRIVLQLNVFYSLYRVVLASSKGHITYAAKILCDYWYSR